MVKLCARSLAGRARLRVKKLMLQLEEFHAAREAEAFQGGSGGGKGLPSASSVGSTGVAIHGGSGGGKGLPSACWTTGCGVESE